jgi:hypothetical protein
MVAAVVLAYFAPTYPWLWVFAGPGSFFGLAVTLGWFDEDEPSTSH